MPKILVPPLQSARTSFGLLIVRVVAGIGLAMHGWGKVQDPFHWADPMNLPAPLDTLAPLAALGEFGGGIMLVLGLLSPLAALLAAGTMLGAIWFHMQNGQPFFSATGGPSYELAALYSSIALMLLFTGPGAMSLDHTMFKRGSH